MADAPAPISNDAIAELLEGVASHLEAQHANIYRIDAYRAGAQVVREYEGGIQQLALESGRPALDALPHIGKSLSAAIDEIAHTGHSRMLDRLEGRMSPVELFQTVPGIGEELAERIHRELHIDTLEALELAAHDGRLDDLAGFGERRIQAVQNNLAVMLSRSARHEARHLPQAAKATPGRREGPGIDLLLDVDREYREKARADALRKIAPARNNPERRAWLPILHTEREGWEFTAMFSNTDRAHELGRTGDWVILYYDRDGFEDQCTIVTEFRGALAGQRVVRGREQACAEYYRE